MDGEHSVCVSSAGVKPVRVIGVIRRSVTGVMSNPSLENRLMTISELLFNKARSGNNVEDGLEEG